MDERSKDPSYGGRGIIGDLQAPLGSGKTLTWLEARQRQWAGDVLRTVLVRPTGEASARTLLLSSVWPGDLTI